MDNEIFKITKDKIRAKDLLELAKERIRDIISIIPKDKQFKIIEEYYETIVQLMTSLMYLDGYKTLSHVPLIKYLSDNYKPISRDEINIIDTLRKLRHGTLYYRKKAGGEFLANHEKTIRKIINSLFSIIEDKLKEDKR